MSGLPRNGVRSHAHAPTHAINLIWRAIIARHSFKYFTYGVRRAHALNTNHIDISHALNTNQRHKKLFRKYLVCISISNKKQKHSSLHNFICLIFVNGVECAGKK